MMKVALNKRTGGFSLSPKALSRLAELKGAYLFTERRAKNRVEIDKKINEGHKKRKATKEDVENGDCGDMWLVLDTNDEDWLNSDHIDSLEFDEHLIATVHELVQIDRTDKDLIQAVEELGEEASGTFANLQVVEVPSNVDWYIEEQENGSELVVEPGSILG